MPFARFSETRVESLLTSPGKNMAAPDTNWAMVGNYFSDLQHTIQQTTISFF